jgi:hypothetical protein
MRPSAARIPILVALMAACALGDPEWRVDRFREAGYLSSFDAPPRPRLSERELDRYADLLALTTDQVATARQLRAALAERLVVSWLEFAEPTSDLQSNPHWNNAERDRLFAEHLRRADRLSRGFHDDLRLVLTPEQASRWPALERRRRRVETLGPYANVEGEAIDLVAIVESLGLTDEESAAIAPTLHDYELRLDRLLMTRNAKAGALGESAADLERKHNAAFRESRVDDLAEIDERRQRLADDALAVRAESRRIARLNEETVATLTPMIPTRHAEDWAQATAIGPAAWTADSVVLIAFLRVGRAIATLEGLERHALSVEHQWARFGGSRDGEIADMLAFVRTVEPLTETQRAAIAELKEELIARVGPTAEAQHELVSGREPTRISVETPAGRLDLGLRDRQAINARNEQIDLGIERIRLRLAEIDAEALKHLRAILTPRQRALIVVER